MPKVLVAYYSRTGSTERVAHALAERLGADLERIRPRTSYAGALGYLKGIWHAIHRRAPAIQSTADPSGCSLVVVASPVWGGRLSAPVRTYLDAQRGKIRGLAAVCVSASGRMQAGAFEEAARLSGRPLLADLPLGERDVRGGAFEAPLESFAQKLRAAAT